MAHFSERILSQMILETINSPQDLKLLSPPQLKVLCSEIRERIISVVSVNGGHLASSLGAVELIVALHYVFDMPKDKIIWDVGHQAYAHKIITGRKDVFFTLRQFGGISGFPSHIESEYDVFTVGHSSTAVSLAVGLAEGKIDEDCDVVAVIGDGSLSGGMCFEALNYAGHSQTDILVVLNSNNMAISPVQGALSKYVNRIISGYTYNKLHNAIREAIARIPAVGKEIVHIGTKIEEAIKGLVVSGWLFEELGFRYFGPVDGHNIDEMVSILRRIRELNGPRILHIVTQKGKGYSFAEKNPTFFHGVMQFDVSTGKVDKSGKRTFTSVVSEVLLELFESDASLVGVTAAMLDGTGLKVVYERFKDRVYDVGIAEEHATTFASGLSRAGKLPVVAIYSTFLQRAYDQLVCDIALQDVGVIFAVDRAGIVGEDGVMHHGLMDICYLKSIPNMTVLAPRDASMIKKSFLWAVDYARKYKKPVAIRYPKDEVPEENYTLDSDIVLGRGNLVYDGGQDLVIFSVGSMVYPVLEVVSENNLSVRVVDVVFVNPIDEEFLFEMVSSAKLVVTVEEGYICGGYGETVCRILSKRGIRVIPVGIENKFIYHGKRNELLRSVGLDKNSLLNLFTDLLSQMSL